MSCLTLVRQCGSCLNAAQRRVVEAPLVASTVYGTNVAHDCGVGTMLVVLPPMNACRTARVVVSAGAGAMTASEGSHPKQAIRVPDARAAAAAAAVLVAAVLAAAVLAAAVAY